MTSGPTQFPQGPKLPGTAPQSAEPNARLIGVPNDLKDVKAPVRLAGRVAEAQSDGRVRIETPRGSVEIILPKNEIPREGARVEIVIPPGRPPQQAVIRPAPEQNIPRPSQPAPQPTPSRPAQTPVDVHVPSQRQTRPPPATPPLPFEPAPPRDVPLQPQDVIQLLPLAPRLEAEITVPQPDTVAAPVIDRAVFTAQLAVIEAGNEILKEALQILQPVATAPAPVSEEVPKNISPLPQPQLTQTVTEFPALNNPAPEKAVPVPVETSAIPKLVPPEILSVLPAAAVLDAIPALLTSAAAPPVQNAPRLPQPIAAQVVSILPPPVNVFTPGTAPPQTPQEVLKHFLAQQPEKAALADHAAPAITNTAQPQAATAIVTGTIAQLPVVSFFTDKGEIIQNFVLQPAAPGLAPGTIIQISPLPVPAAAMTAPQMIPLPLSFLTPEPWPLMQQIYNLLIQAAPQAAQSLANVTPNAAGNPAQLGPAALFFLAAVRAGDLTGWLSEKGADILRRDARGLLSRLTQEGNALSRLTAEPVSQDWRAMSIPLYWQGEIHKMALYYKRDYSEGREQDEKGGTARFIFDLTLSAMGKVQLDGLMRGKKLDLIVRTQQAFSQAAQMQMRRAYVGALDSSGLTGELSFQNKPEQWVHINPQGKEVYSADI